MNWQLKWLSSSKVNLPILLLTVALNSWAAAIVHRLALSLLWFSQYLPSLVHSQYYDLGIDLGNTVFESFSLLRKERNGLNAAIVLDCIANSLTMVTSIFFFDQLTPFCMYEYTWQTLHVFWQSPFFILNSPSVCALLCVAMVASHIRVMFLSSCIWIASM